jgi:predicted short-subunit dehydrogenase-like oxidoreductase (DUF2520 family)
VTRFAVVGPGHVGRAIARLLARSGWDFLGFAGRDRGRTRSALRFVGHGRALPGLAALSGAKVVLVSVPDGAVPVVARAAASEGGAGKGSLWVHTSGALPASALSPVEASGARVGSLHPLSPFPSAAEGARSMPGSACAIEGPPHVLRELRRLARALGCRPFVVRAEMRPLYHAAAVMASNYVVALLGVAAEVLDAATAGTARDESVEPLAALLPIARATLAHVSALGIDGALTGPLARADRETVALHLRELRSAPVSGAERLYRALGEAALRILVRRGDLPERDLLPLRALLRGSRREGSRHG